MSMEAVRDEITQLIDNRNHPEFIRGVYATLNIRIGGEVVCSNCSEGYLKIANMGEAICPVCNGALKRPRTLMDMIEEGT